MAEPEIIVRPNTLAGRIGPRARVFTAPLMQQAEQALAKVSTSFVDWLQDDIVRAETAIARLGDGAANTQEALGCVRQLRSSGSAFDYPIIFRIAGSLCSLLEGKGPAPLRLATAHIEAIKVAARDGIRMIDDPVANATCAELEAQTRAYLAGRPG